MSYKSIKQQAEREVKVTIQLFHKSHNLMVLKDSKEAMIGKIAQYKHDAYMIHEDPFNKDYDALCTQLTNMDNLVVREYFDAIKRIKFCEAA